MARDLQTGQVVGLKILDPKKTAAFEARFKGLSKPPRGRNRRQLKHPNIVETAEFGLTTEGAPYLVMEYLEGPNVNAALAAHDPCLMATASTSSARRPRRSPPSTRPASSTATSARGTSCSTNNRAGPEADRLRADGAGHAVVHAAGQPHRHAQLHGPRAGPPARHGPAARRVRLRGDGLRVLHVRAALAAGHDRHGRHDPRPAARPTSASIAPTSTPALAKAIHACIEPELIHRCGSIKDFLRMIRKVRD